MIYRRLVLIHESAVFAVAASGAAEGEIRSVEKIDRRRFLIKVGATTATVTVLTAGLGAVLASAERRRQEEEEAATTAHQSEEPGE